MRTTQLSSWCTYPTVNNNNESIGHAAREISNGLAQVLSDCYARTNESVRQRVSFHVPSAATVRDVSVYNELVAGFYAWHFMISYQQYILLFLSLCVC